MPSINECWGEIYSSFFAQNYGGGPLLTSESGRVSGQSQASCNFSVAGQNVFPLTRYWIQERQLSSGTDTFDLTALPDGTTLDLTNKRVRIVSFRAFFSNSDDITVKANASTGYPILGEGTDGTAANGVFSSRYGTITLLFGDDSQPVVSASKKDVLVTSPDSDARYKIMIAAG